MEEEELPPVSMTPNFSPAPMRRVRRPSLSSKLTSPSRCSPTTTSTTKRKRSATKRCSLARPTWVVTGDLMSLLLTFFVLILEFSTMDPVKFKVVRGSLDTALDPKKDLGEEYAADNMILTEFSRRDFNKQIESILKKALRDTFPPGQEPGRAEKVNDIRGEVVRFIAYDLFLPGASVAPKAKTVYQVMADTLVNMNARMEVRGIALERFAQDLRQRGQGGAATA